MEQELSPKGTQMTVGSVCTRDVVIATPEMTVVAAAKLMREFHVGTVIVVDGDQGKNVPIGILTDRDIVVEVLAQDVVLESVTVGDVMSHSLLVANEDDGIWDTVQRMRTRGVRRIAVVDGGGTLVGVLSVDDLLSLLGEEFSALSALFVSEQRKEARLRTRP